MKIGAAMCAAILVGSAIGCSEAPLDAVALSPRVLADHLVAHWALDDGAGTVAKDSSGNHHDGQVSGGTWIAGARFGGGLRLAAGDAITVPDFPAATPNWSIALWIRLSNEQLAADSGTFTEILSTENIGSAGWQMNIDRQLAQPRFVFSYWAPPLMNYVGTECSCVDTGAWLHVAAVVDVGSNRLTLYRDGVAADQATRPSDILPGDSTLYFGRWNMGGRLLIGDLDDVAIWGRALTADEVATLTTHSP